jgi:phosphoglycerate dehydrogenase-like enzyme
MPETFRVGLTRDFLKPDGSVGFGDIGLESLDVPGVKREFLAEDTRELRPDQIRGYDALLVLAPKVTAATLEGADRLAVVARFGVGYDSVDVDALTRKGILLTITPEGVRRPVASSTMAFVLALAHKVFVKDRLTREGRWADRLDHMGTGLTGRVLGGVGLGNIGREVFDLARPFGMRHVAYDPYVKPESARAAGVELVDLPTLLRTADFVFITCQLTPETRHLINAERLALMKPSAYLINVARGPIVDQKALTEALRARRIAGAAIDVFEREPVDPDDPLLTLDNVIVTPHAICWTDECFRGNGLAACRSILDVAAGRVPKHVVNGAALDHPRLKEILARRARAA